MFLSAAQAKLNVYTGDTHFQNALDQITASQDEGVMDFDVDVQFLDDDQIQDLVLALYDSGYTANFNVDAYTIDVKYD